MNIFKNLFLKFYPDIIEQITEENFASGFIAATIIRRLNAEDNVTLSTTAIQILSGISERCKYEDLRIDNWEKVFKILRQIGGIYLDSHVAKGLARLNSLSVQNFAYRLFGLVVHVKEQKQDGQHTGQSKLTNSVVMQVANFEKLNNAQSLAECHHVFEKLAFMLSQSLEIKPFQVR